MQTDDGGAVATYLGEAVERGERDRLVDAALPGADGAHTALETFYHAFNTRSLELFRQVWLDDPLIQLNNPVGGIVRYAAPGTVVFAGRERGTYELEGHDPVPLDIRTSRIFGYVEDRGGWRQIHHHGSIDDPEGLARYQGAVRGALRARLLLPRGRGSP